MTRAASVRMDGRGRGARAETAVFYVDAYLEYREASKNIDEHGAMVLHPRTANPIENPYLKVRDRAFLRLRKVSRSIAPGKVAWLW